MVPRVLVLAQVVTKGDPCLLDVCPVFRGPVCHQGVQSFDVLEDDLAPRVCKFGTDLVIDDILQASLVLGEAQGVRPGTAVGPTGTVVQALVLQIPRKPLVELLLYGASAWS